MINTDALINRVAAALRYRADIYALIISKANSSGLVPPA